MTVADRQSGFSLVELLVVISIVALLIALLLPAVRRAREQARVAVCASNLHQVTLAIHAYAADHEGVFPSYRGLDAGPPYDSPSPSGTSWAPMWDMAQIGGTDQSDQTEVPDRRKLRDYASPEGFRCPSDTGYAQAEFLVPAWSNGRCYGDGTAYRWWGSSYLYNATYQAWNQGTTDYRWVLHGRTVEWFADTARQVAIADHAIWYAWPYLTWQSQGLHGSPYNWHDPPQNHPDAPSPYAPDNWLWYGYDPLCNVGFLDAHVSFLRLGPYSEPPRDYGMNTAQYIIDPDYVPP